MDSNAKTDAGYLAVPEAGGGPGVIVLHAWWGLNDYFRALCDRLAAEGFVAYAPDLYGGATADTVEGAEKLMKSADNQAIGEAAVRAVDALRAHPAVRGGSLGAIGFSMGAFWASMLAAYRPDQIAAVAMFYGASDADFSAARAAFQVHMAANDPWEPQEYLDAMEQAIQAAGRELEVYTYEGAGHWFMEANRPADYNDAAAALAWERMLSFMRARL